MPDLTRQARNDTGRTIESLRLTWQITPRNKLNLFWDEQQQCSGSSWTEDIDGCRKPQPGWIQGGSATSSPESATYTENLHRVQQATWTSPVTNRVLVEVGFGTYLNRWGGKVPPGNPTLRSGSGDGTGWKHPGPGLPLAELGRATGSARTPGGRSVSYITGAHNMKFGYQGALSRRRSKERHQQQQSRLPAQQRHAEPDHHVRATRQTRARVGYTALYAQEQWTRGRLTLQGAVRYDHAWSYFPEQQVGPEQFVPVPIVFPRDDRRRPTTTSRRGWVRPTTCSGPAKRP